MFSAGMQAVGKALVMSAGTFVLMFIMLSVSMVLFSAALFIAEQSKNGQTFDEAFWGLATNLGIKGNGVVAKMGHIWG